MWEGGDYRMSNKTQINREKEIVEAIRKIKNTLSEDDGSNPILSKEIQNLEQKFLEELFVVVSCRFDKAKAKNNRSRKLQVLPDKEALKTQAKQ